MAFGVVRKSGSRYSYQPLGSEAAQLSLSSFQERLMGYSFVLMSNDTSVVAYVNKEAPSHGPCVILPRR